jgi:hypothetical protein
MGELKTYLDRKDTEAKWEMNEAREAMLQSVRKMEHASAVNVEAASRLVRAKVLQFSRGIS